MKMIKGERLLVNLSASQVRRRLRGVGYGVRKVETAGKNQAVIIHTARGQNLRELQMMFSDVIAPPPASAEEIIEPQPDAIQDLDSDS